jgi:membrane protease YdiL (CAAX protease family)
LLFISCGAGILISGIITILIGQYILHVPTAQLSDALMQPANIQLTRIIQVFTSFLYIGMPALIVASIANRQPTAQLGFNTKANIRQVLIIILMVIAGFLLSGALSKLNEMIPIPKTAENYFRKLEDNYDEQVMFIGNMHSPLDFILSLIVLAVAPAIFEEMLFRGTLQKIIVSFTRNAFWGILITSIIFSVIHISYYGFLPRIFLGLMIGYIFYYSKNLWLSILAHFLNNAYSVTIIYMLSNSGKLTADKLNDSLPLYYGLIGGTVIFFLFVAFRRESEKILLKNEMADMPQNLL